jgi:hypothetical protein
METIERLKVAFPNGTAKDIPQWVDAGREYAARLDKLPTAEQEAVAYLFAAYGACNIDRYKRAFRASIDIVIRPFYPGAGVDHAAKS